MYYWYVKMRTLEFHGLSQGALLKICASEINQRLSFQMIFELTSNYQQQSELSGVRFLYIFEKPCILLKSRKLYVVFPARYQPGTIF